MSSSTLDLFAVTAPGIAPLTAAELQGIGITPHQVEAGGIAWTGTLGDVYAANLCLRTASRVLVRVASFRASTFYELERRAKRVPWERYVARGRPVRFRVTCRKSRLYHSDAVAQRLAATVAPLVGDDTLVGVTRGSDEDEVPNAQLFVVRVDHDLVTISADASGALLHRRGYRQAVAKAPLRETLAAAMLLASGWDRHSPLVDPMCGSGTIAIEAALLARKIAPGQDRTFSFTHWSEHAAAQWAELKHRARDAELPRAPGIIRASDRDAGAVRAAFDNAERARVAVDVDVSQCAISAVEPAGGKGWVLTNPPYGMRVGDDSVRNLYAQFGKVLRATFPGWNLAVLSADRSLDQQIRIPLVPALQTSNGGIPVRLMTGVVEVSPEN